MKQGIFKLYLSQFFQSIRKNTNYIIFSSIIFFASVIVGYMVLDKENQFISAVFSEFEGLVKDIQSKDSVIYTMFAIFKNNVISTFFMIIFGVFFGFLPLFSLVINGLLIGFVIKMVTVEAGQSFTYFLVGILPHGILELPAVIIAASYGIKLGFTILKIGISFIVKSKYLDEHKKEIIMLIRNVPAVILGVVVILFFAAIIESTLTGYLLTNIYN